MNGGLEYQSLEDITPGSKFTSYKKGMTEVKAAVESNDQGLNVAQKDSREDLLEEAKQMDNEELQGQVRDKNSWESMGGSTGRVGSVKVIKKRHLSDAAGHFTKFVGSNGCQSNGHVTLW